MQELKLACAAETRINPKLRDNKGKPLINPDGKPCFSRLIVTFISNYRPDETLSPSLAVITSADPPHHRLPSNGTTTVLS
jgi:hypothetical protein